MVECSRKQPVATTPVPSDLDGRFREPMFRLLRAAADGIDAIIVVLDTDPSLVAQAMASAEAPIASSQYGAFFDEGIGACLVIRRRPPDSPLLQVSAQQRIDSQQKKKILVRTFDSHRFNSILASFNEKRQRKQLPNGHIGILCFDLDLSNLPPDRWYTYLEVGRELLRNRVWRGGFNTRIAGIILTATPELSSVEADGWQFLRTGMHMLVVKPDVDSLPDWFLPNDSDQPFNVGRRHPGRFFRASGRVVPVPTHSVHHKRMEDPLDLTFRTSAPDYLRITAA
jgi:hypothetical protein